MSDQHDVTHVNYLLIFIVLCVFTGFSVVMDVIHIESKAVLAVIVLSVSVCKALCVMMFFMHLKFEGNWKYVLLAPTTILAIGLPLAILPDIGLHYYLVDVPQVNYEITVPHGEGMQHAGDVHESDSSHEKPEAKKEH